MSEDYEFWLDMNRADLMRAFVEDNRDLYDAFMLQFGEDTHEFIVEGFCDYHRERFDRYCRDKYFYEEKFESEELDEVCYD